MVAGGGNAGLAEGAAFLGAFLAGALLWSVALSAAVAWGRRRVGPALLRPVNAACGLVLGAFGLRLLWRGARGLAARLPAT